MKYFKLLFILIIMLTVILITVSCGETTTKISTFTTITENSTTTKASFSEKTSLDLQALKEMDTIYFQYSVYSEQNIIIYKNFSVVDNVVILNDNLEEENIENIIYFGQEKIQIKNSYLKLLPLGIFKFYIVVGSDLYPVEINITDKQTPYIISSTNIYTDGSQDIYLQYELFGGEIYSVNGTATDTVPFTVNSNTLIIEKEFILAKFTSNNFFVLSYVINIGEDSVIGYLYFNLEE